jgi:hypothetical protein
MRPPNHDSLPKGILKIKSQASAPQNPEIWQSQNRQRRKKRLALNQLRDLHGRLSMIETWRNISRNDCRSSSTLTAWGEPRLCRMMSRTHFRTTTQSRSPIRVPEIRVAPVRRPGREGACAYLHQNESRAQGRQSSRRAARGTSACRSSQASGQGPQGHCRSPRSQCGPCHPRGPQGWRNNTPGDC